MNSINYLIESIIIYLIKFINNIFNKNLLFANSIKFIIYYLLFIIYYLLIIIY